MINTSSIVLSKLSQIEGQTKVNLKYQSKRSDSIMQGTLFKYNEKNLEKVQKIGSQDHFLYQF